VATVDKAKPLHQRANADFKEDEFLISRIGQRVRITMTDRLVFIGRLAVIQKFSVQLLTDDQKKLCLWKPNFISVEDLTLASESSGVEKQ